MIHKRILVLANSIKQGGRCVAGREIIDGPSYALGPWLRPVSQHGEGELCVDEIVLADGAPVAVGDFVELPLERKIDDPGQPENWLIGDRCKWQPLRGAYQPCPAAALEEHPPDLWKERNSLKTDRCSNQWLQWFRPNQSLFIIRPEDFVVRVDLAAPKPKWRALFRYADVRYNLSITDPVFLHRYAVWGHGPPKPVEHRLQCGDRCLLCVSLAAEYQGHHYKIAATIFEDVP